MTNKSLKESANKRTSAFSMKQAGAASLAGSIVFGMLAFAGVSPAAAAERAVMLDTAGGFAVLAGTTVTNTGPSVLNQSLGLYPGSAVTGFPPGLINNGVINAGDLPALSGQTDLRNAYNDAANRPATAQIPNDLAGQTLVGGVYESANGPLELNGVLTLDGANDPSSVFILQSDSTLITGSASRVNLINGAQACNVFWQVGSSATLGSGSSFAGSILALTSITAENGAVIEGRALARNGAVTLDSNVFTTPGCDMSVEPPAEEVPPVEPPVEEVPPVEPPVEEVPPVEPPVEEVPPVEPPVEEVPPVEPPVEEVPPVEPPVEEVPPVEPPVEEVPPVEPPVEEVPPVVETPPGVDTPNDSSTPELPPTGASSATPWFAGGGILLLVTGLGFLFSNRLKFGSNN